MTPYPVTFDTGPFPERHQRMQLLLRLGVVMLLAVLGAPLGWIFTFLYLALPVVAAAVVSSRGPAGYLDELGPRIERGLRWLFGLYAWLAFLADRPPSFEEPGVRYQIARQGTPTVGSALVRLVTSLPEAFAFALLGVLGAFLWFVGALFILVGEGVPRPILSYQRGLLRWQARLFAYHASLVPVYPPLAFDTGDEPAAPADAAAGR